MDERLLFILQQSTLDRKKKKNISFSRKFPFMKSKDDKNEDGSDQEREFCNWILGEEGELKG